MNELDPAPAGTTWSTEPTGGRRTRKEPTRSRRPGSRATRPAWATSSSTRRRDRARPAEGRLEREIERATSGCPPNSTQRGRHRRAREAVLPHPARRRRPLGSSTSTAEGRDRRSALERETMVTGRRGTRSARRRRPRASAAVLPTYDVLIVAYRGPARDLVREPPREGLLTRTIAIDGRTVGGWKRTLAGGSVASRRGGLPPTTTRAARAGADGGAPAPSSGWTRSKLTPLSRPAGSRVSAAAPLEMVEEADGAGSRSGSSTIAPARPVGMGRGAPGGRAAARRPRSRCSRSAADLRVRASPPERRRRAVRSGGRGRTGPSRRRRRGDGPRASAGMLARRICAPNSARAAARSIPQPVARAPRHRRRRRNSARSSNRPPAGEAASG